MILKLSDFEKILDKRSDFKLKVLKLSKASERTMNIDFTYQIVIEDEDNQLFMTEYTFDYLPNSDIWYDYISDNSDDKLEFKPCIEVERIITTYELKN